MLLPHTWQIHVCLTLKYSLPRVLMSSGTLHHRCSLPGWCWSSFLILTVRTLHGAHGHSGERKRGNRARDILSRVEPGPCEGCWWTGNRDSHPLSQESAPLVNCGYREQSHISKQPPSKSRCHVWALGRPGADGPQPLPVRSW